MKKRKKSLVWRIKRLKRLYRLKKKKMIIITAAYSAIAVMCFAILVSAGKNEPVPVSTADSETSASATHITDAPTQAAALTDDDIGPKQRTFTADMNYDEYLGMDMTIFIDTFGSPDVCTQRYLVYQDILFDSYNIEAVFYVTDGKLSCTAISFHTDYRQTATSYFEYMSRILIDKFGVPSELISNSDDSSDSVDTSYYTYSIWKQTDLCVTLKLLNDFYNGFDFKLTYTSPDSWYCPNRESLKAIADSTPEQPTEPVNSSTLFFTGRDYGEYWGCDTAEIINGFGTPDEYGENQLIYKNGMFADMFWEYSAELTFDLNDNGELCMITVNLRSIGDDYLRTYNIKAGLFRNFGEPDDERRGYKTWITPKSQIELHGSTITYTPN
ncbi:MAG: hypothetical protein NC320_10875 [Clostridium sp.]|nr:hypothetical protein [Clostridium sp.]MCM1548152.1 hypothetical protein [Ruminococcus sp.]